MSYIQHYLPDDHPPTDLEVSESVAAMMTSIILKGQPKLSSWVPIPDTDLEIRLRDWHSVLSLLVRKNKSWAYANVFCIAGYQSDLAMCLVSRLYWKYLQKNPVRPRWDNWIHTIPIQYPALSAAEIGLIHEIIQFIYWSICRLIVAEEVEA